MKKTIEKNSDSAKDQKMIPETEDFIEITSLEDYYSPEYNDLRIEAEKLIIADKLAEAKAAVKSIQRIQAGQPLEVKNEAYQLVILSSCRFLARKSAEIVAEGDAVNPLAKSVAVDLSALQAEMEAGLPALRKEIESGLSALEKKLESGQSMTGALSSVPQPDSRPILALMDQLEGVRSQKEYSGLINKIKESLPYLTEEKYILKHRLEQTLTLLLISLAITDYLKAHPEDNLTSFIFSLWQETKELSGSEAYSPLSFLPIDRPEARLLLPNRLDEKSTPQDFLFCSNAIYEVSESLPYEAVQDLIEQLTTALRNRLDTTLLDLTDVGEAAFGLWDKRQREILYEAIKEAEDAAAPENPDGFLSEVQSVLETLSSRGADADLGCLSTTAYALLYTLLRDKVILSVAYAVEKESGLPEFVKGILPLYIAMLSSASRGRSDFWNDPVFLLWERTIKNEE